MFSRRVWILMPFLFHVLAAAGYSEDTKDPTTAVVETVKIEKAGDETYFRVTVRWPSEEVPNEYREFLAKSLGHRPSYSSSSSWPVDALALIPQSRSAFLVCLNLPSSDYLDPSDHFINPRALDDLPSPSIFLGKLQETTSQDFLLRCPGPDGLWKYLPLKIDFTQASSAEGLAKEWLEAQANFMRSFEAPADQSFFSYARGRLMARMGVPADTGSFRPDARPIGGNERLYEVTTGALALQESLQLDRMRNSDVDRGTRDVPVDQIEGISVQSHPWTQMIGNNKPEIEAIAALVPDDQYYVRFTTTRSLTHFLDFAEAWGGSLIAQMEIGGRDYGVKEKIENQICLKSTWISKLLGPAVIESLAFTGSDPYLREGSDFSVIFHLKVPPVFEATVNRYLVEARDKYPDIQEGEDRYGEIVIQSFITPDHVVRCYRARLDDYYIYSNSPVAIRRIIDTGRGRRSSLAKSLDFVYMRTLYPLKAKQEDGFIFLSDAFIRALVGPRARIAEKRRIEVVTSLEMIKNGALFYLWENPGAKVPALDELYNRGYLDARHVITEPGDRIEWDPEQFVARSECYGRLGYLTPSIELPIEKVTAREKKDYEQFREGYQNYWRRYFDPIGMRITAGEDIAVSLTILPLINNSTYNDMIIHFGGQAVPLEPINREEQVVMRFAAHLNPESPTLQQIQSFGLSTMAPPIPGSVRASGEWIGERMEFWIEDSEALLSLIRDQQFSKIFQVPITLGVKVKNPLTMTAFLMGIQATIQVSSPNTVIFELADPYKGYAITRVKPAPESWVTEASREADEEWKKAAIYYGKIGSCLYVSTSLDVLHRIIDGMPATQPASAQAVNVESTTSQTTLASSSKGETGHMALRFNLEEAKQSRPALVYFLSRQGLEVEQAHLRNLWLVEHTVGTGPRAAVPPERVLGFAIESTLGNSYHYDPVHDEIVGSATGSLWNPVMSENLPEQSPLKRLLDSIRKIDVLLEFTKDGLRTDLTIRRSGK